MGPGLEGLHPFINPPHAALLYLPFGLPPYPVGLALWWGCGLGVLGLTAVLSCRELPRLRDLGAARLVACAFLFFPTVAWCFYAQATPWIALLYMLCFVQLRRGHDLRAGLCLGALAFKPQLALVLAAVLVAKARWRAVAGGAASAAVSLAAGWALSPEASLRYLEIAPRLGVLLRYSVSEYPTWGVHSVYGFSVLLLDGVSPRAASGLALGLGVALLGLLLRAWRTTPWEPGTRRWDLRLAASAALGLVISPHLFVYDLALLLVPFAFVLEHHPGRAGHLLDGGPLLAWTALLWLACFLGSYLSKGQLLLTESLGAGPVALQLSTGLVVAWSLALWCASGAASGGSPDQQVGS